MAEIVGAAAGVVGLVEQVVDVQAAFQALQAGAGGAEIVAQRGVDQGVAVGLHLVGVVGVARTHRAHAGADLEAFQRAGAEAVVGPHRTVVRGHRLRPLVLVGLDRGLRHLGVQQRQRGDQLQVVRDLSARLELQAARADTAFLRVEAEGVRHQRVALADVERRHREQRVHAGRLVLQPDFILAGLARHERRAAGVDADVGLERGGVADVGREAVVEQVQQAGAVAGGFAGLVGGALGQAVVGILLGPVVAHAQQRAEAAEAELILHVGAGLAQRLAAVDDGRQRADRLAVLRIGDVDGRRGAPVVLPVAAGVLVVDAGQHGVLHRAGGEVDLRLVVERDALDVLDRAQRLARDGAVGGQRRGHLQRAEVDVDVRIAQARAQRQRRADAVFQLVADAVLFALERIELGVADVEAAAEVVLVPGRRQELGIDRVEVAAVRVLLIVRGQREGGVGVGPPGQRRGHRVAAFVHAVVAAVGVAANRAQAVLQRAGLIHGALAAEAGAGAALVAAFEQDLVRGLVGRPATHLVHQAARADLPVQQRRRSLEHVDAVQQVRVDGRLREGLAARQLEAVEEIDVAGGGAEGAEAAQEDRVVARVGVAVGQHAGGVAQGFADGLRRLVVQLLAGDGGDRLGRFEHRGAGLGGRGGGREQDAVAAVGRVGGFALDHHRTELHRFLLRLGRAGRQQTRNRPEDHGFPDINRHFNTCCK
ncbi:Uncharacterised protein [Achromobacter sp. 2789STDY5608628]|nr:Uncharacterised protein [Achromobacter sp. 2789STDY5608628]